MLQVRLIPCLLLDGRGLVKTRRFTEPKYVGDPINAVRIFNDKFVDEIIFLDISATREGRSPDVEFIGQIASECFIPFCYGGGVRSVADAQSLFSVGVEKVSVNTAAIEDRALVPSLSERFGSQSIVVTMDIGRKRFGGQTVLARNGRVDTGLDPVGYAREVEEAGAGELVVNSVDRDGTMQGYDVPLLRQITEAVSIPVVACGGAGSLDHMWEVVTDAGVSAAAAGSLFVFSGKHRAVLISYPSRAELMSRFASLARPVSGRPMSPDEPAGPVR